MEDTEEDWGVRGRRGAELQDVPSYEKTYDVDDVPGLSPDIGGREGREEREGGRGVKHGRRGVRGEEKFKAVRSGKGKETAKDRERGWGKRGGVQPAPPRRGSGYTNPNSNPNPNPDNKPYH